VCDGEWYQKGERDSLLLGVAREDVALDDLADRVDLLGVVHKGVAQLAQPDQTRDAVEESDEHAVFLKTSRERTLAKLAMCNTGEENNKP
jgi:hypothetical protein